MAREDPREIIESNVLREGLVWEQMRQRSEGIRRTLLSWDYETLCRLGTLICRKIRDPETGVLEIRRGAACISDNEGELCIDTTAFGVEGEHVLYDANGRLKVILREVRN